MTTGSAPHTSRRLRYARLGLILLAGTGAAWYWTHPAPAGSAHRADLAAPRHAPVTVAAARASDIPVWLAGLGTVTPVYTVTLHSRVDGEMMKVHYREGQMVKAGDLLAELDPRPFQVQLEQAQGQLAHDQALLDNARLDLKRYQGLIVNGAVPQQQLDTQDALVKQYEAAVLSDQGQVDNAKLQLVYCHISAPVTGRLGLRLVDPGNIVHAADLTGMVVLTQLTPITVIFPLPQDDLPQLLSNLRTPGGLPVQAWDRDNRALLGEGHLMTIDNQVDVTTGMVKLRAEFPNQDQRLFPNQFVNARVQVGTLRGVINIPEAGVQQGSGGSYCYVVNQHTQTVNARKLKTGPHEAGRVVILDGLQAGELVVTDGVDNLREGAEVSITAREGSGSRS